MQHVKLQIICNKIFYFFYILLLVIKKYFIPAYSYSVK